jgi:putative tryptophan/tyrosine transport system substrate-binding protein
MAYAVDLTDVQRQAAHFADKALKSANPTEQASKRDLVVISLKTAKALKLAIPPSLLGRADQVIACPEKGRCD